MSSGTHLSIGDWSCRVHENKAFPHLRMIRCSLKLPAYFPHQYPGATSDAHMYAQSIAVSDHIATIAEKMYFYLPKTQIPFLARIDCYLIDHRSSDQLSDSLTVILAPCARALATKLAQKRSCSLFCARVIIGTPDNGRFPAGP